MLSLLPLELEPIVSGTLIVDALGIWRVTSPFSPPLRILMGGNVTFDDGSIVYVRGKGSVSILRYPNIDEILFVDGLKANLISISQICDNEFSDSLKISAKC